MKIGQAFGIYQHNNATTQFTSEISIPDNYEPKKWLREVQIVSGFKPIGAFIIRSIKRNRHES